jgi:hypothetical protein
MTAAVKPVVTRHKQEHRDTGQSSGAVRISGVSPQHTPAQKLWFGKVSNEPGFRSIYWGENYSKFTGVNGLYLRR